MNKDEILSKSREENHGADEREQQVHLKSSALAKAAGGVLCFAINLLEEILSDRAPVAGLAAFFIYFSMEAIEDLQAGVVLKSKKHIIRGSIIAAVAIAMLVGFIVVLCKGL